MESDKINSMWNLHMCLFSLGAITRMKSNHIDKVYKDDYVHWKEYIKTNIITVLKRKDISKYRKIMLLVGLAFPGLIAKIDVIRRKKISTISVE